MCGRGRVEHPSLVLTGEQSWAGRDAGHSDWAGRRSKTRIIYLQLGSAV